MSTGATSSTNFPTAGPFQTTFGGSATDAFVARISTAAPPASLHVLAPCRVADTRDPNGPRGGPALQPHAVRVFDVAGVCGIPAGAVAVAVNLTVTNVGSPGELVAFPSDILRPTISSISFQTGRTRANNSVLVLAGLSTTFSVFNNSGATVDFVFDVNGYFQ